jgi:hypothetical protein
MYAHSCIANRTFSRSVKGKIAGGRVGWVRARLLLTLPQHLFPAAMAHSDVGGFGL